MANDVDVVFASRRGSFQGTLLPADGRARADRLRAQVHFTDSPQAVELGQRIIEAKIRKQIVLLQRFNRRDTADEIRVAISTMTGLLRMVPECGTTAEAMGMEGAAAAAYFPAIGRLLPEPMRFEVRSRQPPMDVTNAALSFLYMVLLGEAETAVCAAGLEPSLGALHGDNDRRPSLALDLIEEFRPLIVDQVVIEACRRNQLRPEHGRAEPGRSGVLLTKEGRQVVLEAYEERMQTGVRGALPDFAGTWRRHLHRQAQRIQTTISGGTMWSGLTWR